MILIVADDLGYADLGVQGCTDIPTPHIDSLARDGVRCTSAYASSPRCAPTRAGLLTGRYQQRFGCELGAGGGLPAEERTLAERLHAAGYATGLVGKWHLGTAAEDRPRARGFDEFFGFLGGASAYLPRAPDATVPGVLRGDEPAAEKEHLTDALAREAVSFVERHRDEPFFLLLAFNAPHRPLETKPGDAQRFAGIADPSRRGYAALLTGMDDAVGRVLARLRELELERSTLVCFLSDNGGPQGAGGNGSSNGALRGQKGSTYEGGIRVPMLVRWSEHLGAGRTFDEPVSSLDLCPTILAAAGVPIDPAWALDGVDLLPYLEGRVRGVPHETLYWRFGFPRTRPELHRWAIRAGDMKLVRSPRLDDVSPTELFDLSSDPGEQHDLMTECSDVAQRLEERWRAWSASLPVPTAGAREDDDDELDER